LSFKDTLICPKIIFKRFPYPPYVYLFILCVFVVPYVYLLYYACIAILTLDAGLLARSQYPEGPARPATSTQVFLGFPVSTSEC